MSNQAYIVYLQSVAAANTTKQANNTSVVAGLQSSIDSFTAQIASLQSSIDTLNAETSQLAADNVLIGNLIQQLQAPK